MCDSTQGAPAVLLCEESCWGESLVFHLHPYAMKTHIIQQYMVLFEIRSSFTRMLRGCV